MSIEMMTPRVFANEVSKLVSEVTQRGRVTIGEGDYLVVRDTVRDYVNGKCQEAERAHRIPLTDRERKRLIVSLSVSVWEMLQRFNDFQETVLEESASVWKTRMKRSS